MSDHAHSGAAPDSQNRPPPDPVPTPDPHLLAALRHAPDRDASAPAELSRRIAQQARLSLQPRPSLLARGWTAVQALLAQPVAASALGTLVLAGFIGLMWRDGVPPEALPRQERGEQAVPAPVPSTAPSIATSTSTSTSTAAAAAAAAAAAPAPAAQPAASHDSLASGASSTAAPALSDRAITPAAPPVPRARVADGGVRESAAAPPAVQVPAAKLPAESGPRARPPAEPVAANHLPAARDLPEKKSAAEPPREVPAEPTANPPQPLRREASPGVDARPAPPAPAPAAAGAAAAPAAAPMLLRAPPAAVVNAPELRSAKAAVAATAPPSPSPSASLQQQPSADPLAAPLAQLAAAPSDNPLLLATRHQLVSLQRAAQGLWRVGPPLPADAGTPVWDAEGRLLGRLLVRGRDVSWQAVDGAAWRARLPAEHAPR